MNEKELYADLVRHRELIHRMSVAAAEMQRGWQATANNFSDAVAAIMRLKIVTINKELNPALKPGEFSVRVVAERSP